MTLLRVSELGWYYDRIDRVVHYGILRPPSPLCSPPLSGVTPILTFLYFLIFPPLLPIHSPLKNLSQPPTKIHTKKKR